jgi:3'(2'), 5'-bisphosphate nucleotidase
MAVATPEDHDLARKLAEAAGRLLLQLRADGLVQGKGLGALGDCTANAFLTQALRDLRPDDAILSEEEVDDPVRLTSSRVWIIDPLDGTREYSEGRDDWAVHVALTIDGEPVVGAVALPSEGLCLSTAEPQGFVTASGVVGPRLMVSRTRPAAESTAVAELLGGGLVPMGSAGAKAMAVLRGQAEVYLHGGGQYEWDSCAPVAVARAAGLHTSRADGTPLRYNSENPYLPDLLICRPDLTRAVLDARETASGALAAQA